MAAIFKRELGEINMRRKDKEIMDLAIIDSVMKEAEICRIALCEDNEPYIVPMNFGYNNGYLYVHSAKEGKKLDILRRNNKVCFEVDIKTEIVRNEKICDWGMKYYSVIGKGEVTFLLDIEKKIQALNKIVEKYADISFEFAESELNNIEVLEIKIKELTGKKSGY